MFAWGRFRCSERGPGLGDAIKEQSVEHQTTSLNQSSTSEDLKKDPEYVRFSRSRGQHRRSSPAKTHNLQGDTTARNTKYKKSSYYYTQNSNYSYYPNRAKLENSRKYRRASRTYGQAQLLFQRIPGGWAPGAPRIARVHGVSKVSIFKLSRSIYIYKIETVRVSGSPSREKESASC